MKNLYLVSYDIMDSKRLHKVHKTMQGFGERSQYSVFFCRLTAKDKVMLVSKLLEIINQKEDRILIVNLGPCEGMKEESIEILGKQTPPPDEEVVVI